MESNDSFESYNNSTFDPDYEPDEKEQSSETDDNKESRKPGKKKESREPVEEEESSEFEENEEPRKINMKEKSNSQTSNHSIPIFDLDIPDSLDWSDFDDEISDKESKEGNERKSESIASKSYVCEDSKANKGLKTSKDNRLDNRNLNVEIDDFLHDAQSHETKKSTKLAVNLYNTIMMDFCEKKKIPFYKLDDTPREELAERLSQFFILAKRKDGKVSVITHLFPSYMFRILDAHILQI